MVSEQPGFETHWIGARIGEPEWHFHRQLFRRYGIVLGVGQFSQIIKDIRGGCAPLVKPKGTRGGIFLVQLEGVDRPVYVLAIDGIPKTAWPPSHGARLVNS